MPITDMPLGVTAVMLPELGFDEQIALCASLGVTHYTVRPRVIGENQRDKPYSNWGNHKFDLTPRRLLDEAETIRKKLTDAGLTPFGTVPNANTHHSDADLKLHIEGAAAVDAGRVRINPEPYPGEPFDIGDYLKRVIDRYGEIIAMAKPHGVKLVMETHAHSSAAAPGIAREICKPFAPNEIGVMFDMPNFAKEGALQPRLAVAVLRDYIDQCHVGGARRITAGYDASGARLVKEQFCPLTECDLHIPSWLEALARADVFVPLVIEDYTEAKSGALRLTESAEQLKRMLAAIDV